MYLAYLIRFFCIAVSFLPLSWIRGFAKIISFMVINFSSRAYRRAQTNLLLTHLAQEHNVIKMSKQTILEFTQTIVEVIFVVWTKRYKNCIDNVEFDVETDRILKKYISRDQQILFLTPHIGNFELIIEYVTQVYKVNVQVLYKPIKVKFIDYLMKWGIESKYIKLCSVKHKKELLSAIRNFKNGQHIGMLPDSIASRNNGVWVEFFGQQIFASSLAASLSVVPGTVTLLGECIRTKDGFSFKVREFIPASQDKNEVMQQMYKVIEQMVHQYPTQYYWSYDRFRIPKYLK